MGLPCWRRDLGGKIWPKHVDYLIHDTVLPLREKLKFCSEMHQLNGLLDEIDDLETDIGQLLNKGRPESDPNEAKNKGLGTIKEDAEEDPRFGSNNSDNEMDDNSEDDSGGEIDSEPENFNGNQNDNNNSHPTTPEETPEQLQLRLENERREKIKQARRQEEERKQKEEEEQRVKDDDDFDKMFNNVLQNEMTGGDAIRKTNMADKKNQAPMSIVMQPGQNSNGNANNDNENSGN